jgi:hypothetical protein
MLTWPTWIVLALVSSLLHLQPARWVYWIVTVVFYWYICFGVRIQ